MHQLTVAPLGKTIKKHSFLRLNFNKNNDLYTYF